MASDAQRRANAKYQKNNTKQLLIKFYKADSELWEWMDRHGYRGSWVKELIKAEFKKSEEK